MMKKNPAKHCLVCSPLPPPPIGIGTVAQELIKSKTMHQWIFHVVDMSDRSPEGNWGKFTFTNVFLGLKHAWKSLSILMRTPQIEVVYLHLSANFWAYVRDSILILLAKMVGKKLIIHSHGASYREFFQGTNWIGKRLVRSTLKLPEALIVLGERLKPMFDGYVDDDRLWVVPNGMKDVFLPHQGGGDKIRILHISTLFPSKGPMGAIPFWTFMGSGLWLTTIAHNRFRTENVPQQNGAV